VIRPAVEAPAKAIIAIVVFSLLLNKSIVIFAAVIRIQTQKIHLLPNLSPNRGNHKIVVTQPIKNDDPISPILFEPKQIMSIY